MFKYWVYKFGQFCVTHFPLALSYKLAEMLSDIHYYFSFRDRRAVKENLRIVTGFSDQRLHVMAREVFRNFGRYLVEFFRMARCLDDRFIQDNVRLENVEYIPTALKAGRGVILLTAHIGNWEMGGVVLSRLGYSSLAIALPHKERPVNNLFNQQREVQGLKVVSLQLSIRKCLEALNQNECVAVLADRNFTSNGEILEFLGRRVSFPKGPAMFSLRTGAPIVPVFFIRCAGDKFVLKVKEPIVPPVADQEQPEPEKLMELMKTYTKVIEQEIRQYPTQWLMFRKFWVE